MLRSNFFILSISEIVDGKVGCWLLATNMGFENYRSGKSSNPKVFGSNFQINKSTPKPLREQTKFQNGLCTEH
jgi:hypothetical protein